jgi:hypothetical protein
MIGDVMGFLLKPHHRRISRGVAPTLPRRHPDRRVEAASTAGRSEDRAMDPLHRSGASPTDDTDPAIEAMLIEGYRRMSPSQKLERVRALTRAVQQLALLDIRRRHPGADEREQALRLASRRIEPELMLRAFGWDVREAGY